MFTYDVMCLTCGKRPVYTATFREKMTDNEIQNKKSSGVCKVCAPAYQKAVKEKKSIETAEGPFFKLKEGE